MSQILTAQAVASDMEGKAGSCGVKAWARCHLANSERDVHRTMKTQSTTLDVKISTMRCSGVDVPWINPQTWLRFLVRKGLWPLTSGCSLHDHVGSARNWTEFWSIYKKLHPDFPLFEIPGIDLGTTAAIAVHGDEGRTLKKGGLMLTAMQSVLGRGYDEKRVKGQNGESAKLRVNYSGHSFTTRYVLNTMPKTAYDADPAVFSEMIDQVATSLNKCLNEGYTDPDTGITYRLAVVAIKGDAPYLAKVGNFYRSYNTTAKRGEERGDPKGVCPFCLAGCHGFEAEEIFATNPKWLATVGVKLPWVRTPSFVRRLIHEPSDPASMFRSDIWHVVHLGFGRSWVASVLQMVLPMLPFPNLDDKWSHITSEYLGWCAKNHRQAHVGKVTPYLMSYGEASGAMGNWHKGALTSNFLLWLVDFLGKVGRDEHGWVVKCRMATYRMNSMFSVLYRAGAFLTQEETVFVSDQGMGFLICYNDMAAAMFGEGKQFLFPLYPKLHIFHHIILRTLMDGRDHGVAESPMLWACQIDEDTVGRSSRLSRRVNIRRVSERTLQRYLVAAHAAHAKAGLLS